MALARHFPCAGPLLPSIPYDPLMQGRCAGPPPPLSQGPCPAPAAVQMQFNAIHCPSGQRQDVGMACNVGKALAAAAGTHACMVCVSTSRRQASPGSKLEVQQQQMQLARAAQAAQSIQIKKRGKVIVRQHTWFTFLGLWSSRAFNSLNMRAVMASHTCACRAMQVHMHDCNGAVLWPCMRACAPALKCEHACAPCQPCSHRMLLPCKAASSLATLPVRAVRQAGPPFPGPSPLSRSHM